MAPLSDSELEQIIGRDLPGYRVVSQRRVAEDTRAAPDADEVSPGIDALRAKYLGEDEQAAASERSTRGVDGSEGADDVIVAVEPTQTSDAFGHDSRPKTVVVSGRHRRVIGSQG
jgi:hypothetical protein